MFKKKEKPIKERHVRTMKAVSYTHLDVYKRQSYLKEIEDNAKLTEKHLQIIRQQTADTEELITE